MIRGETMSNCDKKLGLVRELGLEHSSHSSIFTPLCASVFGQKQQKRGSLRALFKSHFGFRSGNNLTTAFLECKHDSFDVLIYSKERSAACWRAYGNGDLIVAPWAWLRTALSLHSLMADLWCIISSTPIHTENSSLKCNDCIQC